VGVTSEQQPLDIFLRLGFAKGTLAPFAWVRLGRGVVHPDRGAL